jgi:hypothetical protein
VGVRVVAQYEHLFLVNTGRPVPGKDAAVEGLREGRVYDSAAGRLEPQHGPGGGPTRPRRAWMQLWNSSVLRCYDSRARPERTRRLERVSRLGAGFGSSG